MKKRGKIGGTVRRARRRLLESDEPDAAGRWNPEHRRRVLRYVYDRDGGRCGVCGGAMKIQGAQIDHVVPKVFAYFNVHKGGKVVMDAHYESRMHKLDNLQAAHTYCNKRKGNATQVREWRHATMPSLPVAVAGDGREFLVPWSGGKAVGPKRIEAEPSVEGTAESGGMSTASLWLGIVAAVSFGVPFLNLIPATLALVFGLIGLRRGLRRGRAIAGICCGGFAFLMSWVVIFALVTGLS